MASYLSQPRTFTPYVPEVNSEMYGQLLQKKDQDYNKGVQKIENSITQVASLPVARPADRDYLQNKVNNITTELNQQHGVDWSDQHINNLTTTHIASITNDPLVQNAVSSALTAKKYQADKKADVDENGADAVANADYHEDTYNRWLYSDKPGEHLNVDYISYTDINKKATDFLKTLKPDVQKLVNLADGFKGWEQAIREHEGIDKEKLKVALDEFIATTPGITTQMAINAKYEYKGYRPEDFANRIEQSAWKQVYTNNVDITHLEEQLASTDDNKKKSQINDIILKKQSENKQLVDPFTNNVHTDILSAGMKLFQDNREEAVNNMYAQNWKMGIIAAHSGGEKYKEEYAGMGPRETYFKRQGEIRADNDERRKDAEERRKNAMLDIEYQKLGLLINKAKKEESPTTIPISGADASIIDSDYGKLTINAEQAGQRFNSEQVDFMSNLFQVNGIGLDESGKSKYFDHDPVTKQTVIKQGFIPLSAKTQGDAVSLQRDILNGNLKYGTDYISYKDYLLGYKDSKGVHHDGVYNNLENKHAEGNYGMPNEKNITLGEMSVNQLRQLQTLKKDKEDNENVKVIIDNQWKEHVKRHPELTAGVDDYFRSFTIYQHGQDMHFSEEELKDFGKFYVQQDKEVRGKVDPVYGINYSDLLLRKLYEKYPNLDDDRLDVLLTHFNSIPDKATELQDKETEFKSNAAKPLGLSQTQVGIQIIGGKVEDYKDQARKVIGAINNMNPSGNSYKDARAALEDMGNTTTVIEGYDEYNKETPYYYLVSTKKGYHEKIPVSVKDAATLGFTVKASQESPIEKRLRFSGVANGSNGKLQSTYGNKHPGWENADYLTTFKDNKNEIEVRYGVVHPEGQPYYLQLFMHNNKTGEDLPKEELPFDNIVSLQQNLYSRLKR